MKSKFCGDGVKYTVFELRTTAKSARVDGGQVIILLADGRELRFPVDANAKLSEATPQQQSNVEIICNGTGLHWPDLDEDLSLIGILEGRLGSAT
jgi:hypothetical protein